MIKFQKKLCVLIMGFSLLVFTCVSTKSTFNSTTLSENINIKAVVQTGHSAPITSIAFSQDGRYVLSGSQDHTLKLWDVFLGREIRSFKGHTDVISGVAFIPRSRFIISASWDNTLKIWDSTTSKEVRTLKGHSDRVHSVSTSKDGRYVLSGSRDYSMILWRITDGSMQKVIGGHEYSVRVSSNPGFTATGHEDRDHASLQFFYNYKAQVKTTSKGRNYFTSKHIDAVTSAIIDPSGKFILSSSKDRTLRLWYLNFPTRKKVLSLKDSYLTSISLSPDGKYAICGASDSILRLVDIRKNKLIRTYHGHKKAINSVMFSTDGQHVISASGDGSVKLWDINKTTAIKTLSGHGKGVKASAFSPDGRYIVSGGENGQIILWDAFTGLQVNKLKGSASAITDMALLPGGKYLISANQDGSLKLWNTIDGHQEKVYRGHLKGKTSVAVFSTGRKVISGGREGLIIIWDLLRGIKINSYKITREPIRCISISPDDLRMLVGTENGDLLMVNTNTGKVLWKIKEEESINSVTFSPDGKSVLCTSAAKPFSLRDAYTGSVIQKYQGHFYGVHAASFVPDGRMIISSGGDQTVKAWDVTTGQLLMTYKGHNGNVKLTTISADGHVLASGGDDQKLIFWETKTGKQIMTMSGHSDHITGALFSPDMQYFYSGSGDATIRKWSIPTGTELGRMHGSRDGEWITTTPDGYYSKSVEGNNLVHYVIPGIYETYSYKQFEALFNKPEIVKNRFGGCLNCGKPAPKLSQPPQLELMEHRSIEKTTSQIYPISIKASSVYNIKSLQIFVNGKPAIKKPLNTKDIEISLDIRLFAGANRITVIAYDEYGFFSNPKYLDVFSENANLTKPNLYIIGIGISYYPKLSDKWQLEFAHTDAISLVKSMQKNRGKLYGEIQDNLITNEDATIEKVTRVLDAHSSIGENDIVIIHMAGHGVKDKSGTFYFLTSTVRNIDDPQDGGLNWTLLNTYLSRIKGRVILFLDACHSGSLVTETVVPNDRLAQEFFSGKRGGVMVFSASKGRQYSMESPDIGAGAGIFTFALIQGLSARSNHVDINNNGIVEFMELVDYVSSYVDEETNGNQTPWLSRKELFGDLPLAAVSN